MKYDSSIAGERTGNRARRVKRAASGWLFASALLVAGTVSAQAPGLKSAVIDSTCDRECLLGFVETYLDGLLARDPSRVPFSVDVMFTENNVVMPIGEGLWKTINKVSEAGTEAADIDTGNAAWFGIIEEHGRPAYYGMRIKVEDQRITEVETLVVRRSGMPMPFGDTTKIVHDPAFNEVLPPEQRRSRERLIAIADGYFSTVELNDGQLFTHFDEKDCGRLENGVLTTSAAEGTSGVVAQGCIDQLELGIYRINKRIRERRYPLVDTERGVVVSSAFFDHANTFSRYSLTDGREMDTLLKWPNSITLLEAFRVRDGKIHRIEALFTYVPYFMHSPWAKPGGVGAQ